MADQITLESGFEPIQSTRHSGLALHTAQPARVPASGWNP